jgi:hypothetical protein
MTLDASGNLGIGTTSPSSPLSVIKGAAGNEVARFQNGGSFGIRIIPQIGGSGAVTAIRTGGGESISFDTDNTERARIDSSGNLLVGTTSGSVRLVVDGSTGAASFTGDDLNHYQAIFLSKSASASTHYQMAFIKSTGAVVGAITHNDTTTTYATSSDYRLKNVTGALTGYKERLMSLQPKQGTWVSDNSEFRGFLAHEFANPYRASVVGEKDAIDAKGNPVMQAMQASSSEVIADLVAMVKDLITENESLKARLDAANL